MTDAQFIAWLKDSAAIRCVLMEVNVMTGGAETTRFLSNKGYVTGKTDTPASTVYSPYITGGVQFTETLSLDSTASLSFGDIEIDNSSGDRDSWLDDVWANRSIKVYIGDVAWPRSDFRQIFDGIVTGIDTKSRSKINLKVGDKMQRLNAPVTETLLGGSTQNKDQLIPLVFGECHNVEPLLIDPTINKYQVHNGPIESIIEVRDNGVPVAFTPALSLGQFTLAAQPAGQITCSVQGHVGTNLYSYSEDFTVSAWAKIRSTVTANAALAPDGTMTAEKLVEDTTATNTHYLSRSVTIATGDTVCVSIFAKAGERTAIAINPTDTNFSTNAHLTYNLLTGEVGIPSNSTATAWMVDYGDGWWRCCAIFKCILGASLAMPVQLMQDFNGSNAGTGYATYTGDGTSGAYLWGFQLEIAPTVGPYCKTAGAAGNVYRNTASELVKLLATSYGKVTTPVTQFGYTEIDLKTFSEFHRDNPQPVGLYIKDRVNLIECMNKLAASVGGRVLIDRNGKLSIVKLDLPRVDTGTTVEPKDIVLKSIQVSRLPEVVAAVQIGYCKNYTVQSQLQTGIPASSLDLFAKEWLDITATDTLTQTNYITYVAPTRTETQLLTASDALAEANRRLGMFSTQRKVFKYVGMPHLMLEQLGASQTLMNPRFGLEAGKTGQIVSLATDWLNPHITVEVLI